MLFCSLNCLVTAVETYHFYESKLNFSKAFPKDDLGSNLHLLPLRLILQKPPSFFSSSPSLGRDYGCGLLLQEIAAYPCLDSMVTHMEDQGALGQMEMGVTAMILLHCLTTMEFLEQQQQLQGLALNITTLLYHYQAKVRFVHNLVGAKQLYDFITFLDAMLIRLIGIIRKQLNILKMKRLWNKWVWDRECIQFFNY